METMMSRECVKIERADECRGLYFPIASECGLKSAITPDLAGDAKTDQNHFLFEPTSIENLTETTNSRNFWITKRVIDNTTGDVAREAAPEHFSLTGRSAEQLTQRMLYPEAATHTALTVGYMWQQVERHERGILSRITSFLPYDKNTEVHQVSLTNTTNTAFEVTLTAALPIYGRSADNLRDHRHVTSLLHRTAVEENGIFVTPTMSFDERGHKVNDVTYFVTGYEGDGTTPAGFYPNLDHFSGETGNLLAPEAIYRNLPGITVEDAKANPDQLNGVEVMGGLTFSKKVLRPGSSLTYLVLAGVGETKEEALSLGNSITTQKEAEAELARTRAYWQDKVKITVETGDEGFDLFLRWVAFQPELRRVYGCSFLPHHDYGRGGRGWRDLWQDCLALLLMNPESVREQLIASAGGFRMDGTNATIIGEKLGEFKADRNGIPRIWMDHGFWPYLTSELYFDLTGDKKFWIEQEPYFCDTEEDYLLRTETETRPDRVTPGEEIQGGDVYYGTHMEHLLIATLRAFYDAGEHGMMRLRGADWNDALDLAADKGESVAFTHAYTMNLRSMANRMEEFLGQEMEISTNLKSLLEIEATTIEDRQNTLNVYEMNIRDHFKGTKEVVKTAWVQEQLQKKADFLENLLREQEWMSLKSEQTKTQDTEKSQSLYRSYYDNDGESVTAAMLTGQVFSVMSGIATEEQVDSIIETVKARLTDASVGGVRLNEKLPGLGEKADTGIRMNLGRMTGFAFGTKENGAVFSHMSVMYANALLHRHRVDAGFDVLAMLYRQAMDQKKSKMLPGIPEYFDPEGRGVYTYLTGAASWFLYTSVCELFGVHYRGGEVEIAPQLPEELFGEKEEIAMTLPIHGEMKKLTVKRDMSYRLEER